VSGNFQISYPESILTLWSSRSFFAKPQGGELMKTLITLLLGIVVAPAILLAGQTDLGPVKAKRQTLPLNLDDCADKIDWNAEHNGLICVVQIHATQAGELVTHAQTQFKFYREPREIGIRITAHSGGYTVTSQPDCRRLGKAACTELIESTMNLAPDRQLETVVFTPF